MACRCGLKVIAALARTFKDSLTQVDCVPAGRDRWPASGCYRLDPLLLLLITHLSIPIRESSAKVPTHVCLPANLVHEACSLGINLSRACQVGVEAALKTERERRWKAENADAITAYNQWVEEHGIPSKNFVSFATILPLPHARVQGRLYRRHPGVCRSTPSSCSGRSMEPALALAISPSRSPGFNQLDHPRNEAFALGNRLLRRFG